MTSLPRYIVGHLMSYNGTKFYLLTGDVKRSFSSNFESLNTVGNFVTVSQWNTNRNYGTMYIDARNLRKLTVFVF